MTVSDAIIHTLTDWGVDVVFGLPGDGINGFMEALRKARNKIRYIHMRHEEAAARKRERRVAIRSVAAKAAVGLTLAALAGIAYTRPQHMTRWF